MRTSLKFILLASAASLLAHEVMAQRPGVNPIGATDLVTDQFYGKVRQVDERVYAVDYSRHVLEKGDFVSGSTRIYNASGMITGERTTDAQGELLTRTVYQYKDSVKYVSTTYGAAGDRTLQTLYAYTADGHCARLRFTDAIGVTISTSEVSHGPRWAMDDESFADGESVVTQYYFNADYRLVKVEAEGGDGKTAIAYTLDADGHPKRMSRSAGGRKTVVTFDYTLDAWGNWTRRVSFIADKPFEVAERTISYY